MNFGLILGKLFFRKIFDFLKKIVILWKIWYFLHFFRIFWKFWFFVKKRNFCQSFRLVGPKSYLRNQLFQKFFQKIDAEFSPLQIYAIKNGGQRAQKKCRSRFLFFFLFFLFFLPNFKKINKKSNQESKSKISISDISCADFMIQCIPSGITVVKIYDSMNLRLYNYVYVHIT